MGAATQYSLPPGPPQPRFFQTLAWMARPYPFMERCRDRYGDIFTLKVANEGNWVFLSDPEHQLWELSAIDVPEGVDGKEIQTRILRDHGIEVGGGLGPTAPPIWRVGLMGVNANRQTADRVLAAFDDVLPR